jgi:hypothetical protein
MRVRGVWLGWRVEGVEEAETFEYNREEIARERRILGQRE